MNLREFDVQSRGIKGTALICMKERDATESLKRGLKGMDFGLTEAKSAEDALEKMRFNQYDLIIIEEGFNGALSEDRVLTEIKNMGVAQRRRLFVALFGDKWKSADEMLAFTLSVNLLINRGDLREIEDILYQGMVKNRKFYKVFNELREAIGKA